MPLPTIPASALAAGTALLLLGGCAAVDEVLQGDLETVEFDCDGDRDIRVAFMDDGEEARLFSGEDSVDLRLTDTRDGGDVRVYEDGRGTVRMVDRGERIDVSIADKEDFEDCEPQDRGRRRDSGAF